MQYGKMFSNKITPQNLIIPGSNQVPNNGGGFGFEIDKWTQLTRFLILGSEGGTYYVAEQKLTIDNAKNVIECIKEDGLRAIKEILNISCNGRAHKNEPAIFTLILCTIHGDLDTRKMAYESITVICRTGTHLFTFCQYVQDMRGWSAGLRKGVANFYLSKTSNQLAMQLIKYRQRNGWTHKDTLRLSHTKPKNDDQNKLFKFSLEKEVCEQLPLIDTFKYVQDINNPTKEVIKKIIEYKLPWETLPTELLNKPEIWQALLPSLGLTALIRNLGKMTAIGLLVSSLEENTQLVIKRLINDEELKKARIHPMTILLAMKTYASGRGFKGSLSWSPVQAIVSALDAAFYKTFNNVQPTGKNILIGLDVSGSMDSSIAKTSLSVREAACAMSMITIRTEEKVDIVAFSDELLGLKINARARLDHIVQATKQLSFSATDCSLPILHAIKHKLIVDAFIIYTDNETNYGIMHPSQALKLYRKQFNPEAKLIVCGMTATNISIADPADKGMLDCVGMDANLPVIINEFIKGYI